MRSSTAARSWWALTALIALAGLVVQLFVTVGVTDGHFTTVTGRVVNMFCFFTIESNVLVALTCALLAANPNRTSTLFRVLRLAAVVGIAVTGVVYHTVLAGLSDLSGAAQVADILLHTASPIACVLGWLVFGPRGMTSPRIALLAAIFPLAYLALVLIRGPIVDFYPYPFLDVTDLGYPAVAGNSVLVGALFLAVAGGATLLDRVLARRLAPAT